MVAAVLICDDSNLARKQMARALPAEWQQNIQFAGHGGEALDILQRQSIDLLFLDLNMPILDGYQVLAAIQQQQLSVKTIVVSGDIQPEARERVLSYGALDFIKKPVDQNKLNHVLGLVEQKTIQQQEQAKTEPKVAAVKNTGSFVLSNDLRDVFQELSNVAMGQAGDLLARLLKVFVKLPIPNVNVIEVSELHMAIASVEQKENTSAVCQGFIGGGVAGEALLILNDSSFVDIARLMQYDGELTTKVELELLMDIANILIGAVLKGLAEQIDMTFSQGHPVVLGQHAPVSELIKANARRWRRTLAIEISYGIENYNISCDLLLLFTEDSIKTLNYKVEFLLED
ncbi:MULTISPECIES: response regulator [Rheinheimera]|jgi:chemotaxis protein CheY-P-specific phosphatase CheC|uniref:Response regulator n=1 Tax=Rheinheimera tangshanensis TaxID=400153 RepID=A0A5C8LP28_9GAMM|nr:MULTISPECIES: response regulator [Rheinheimera]KOO59159.1 chemotaxis protein CheC [Rheinheimera sp. KL1]MBP8228597.1 response regulator [Rheinheimera sp.]TXK77984.1 response regulator [Rheinheimera tangshanensis]GGM71170.1 transcriptional regulator [Rheinheimera tangshanensis]